MGALPRPDLPAGPSRQLNDALHDLHHAAGWPSLRTLARAAGCSHTTVSNAFSSPRLPAWGLVELLVEAMGGDHEQIHALWLAAGSAREEGVDAPRPLGGMAGRRVELATVCYHLDAVDSGLIVITGEAGMGKTTLVTTAAREADALVATGHCLPLSSEVPLLPFADALRQIYDLDDGHLLEEALRGAPPYVRPSLARLLPELEEATAVPGGVLDQQRLYAAVGSVLSRIRTLTPFALLIEDLHWVDGATLDLLEYLLARILPVPAIATWRTEDPEVPDELVRRVARLRRLPSVSTLRLDPLTLEETGEQLRLLAGTPPGRDDVRRIQARSQGQPLFTEQLARQPTDHLPDDLPEQLAELLDRRLALLPPLARAVCEVLGVADRPLDHETLQRATDDTEAELEAALRELQSRSLLASTADGRIQLRHPLLAEATRHTMLPGTRARLHGRVAEVLGGLKGCPPAEVAAHWQAAGRPAEELLWQVRAAQLADTRFAAAQSVESWIRVLDLWPAAAETAGDPPVRRPEAWLAAVNACELLGGSERTLGLLDRALTEAPAWTAADRAELLYVAARVQARRSGGESGFALLDEAIELYRSLPASEGLVKALDNRANWLFLQGRTEAGSQSLDEALDVIGQLPGSPLERGLRATAALRHTQSGDVDCALHDMRAVAASRPTVPEPVRDVWVAVLCTDIQLMACRPPSEIEKMAREALEPARRWGIESLDVSTLQSNVALAWLGAGRTQRAADALAPTIDQPVLDTNALVHIVGVAVELRRRGPASAIRRAGDIQHPAFFRDFLDLTLAECELWAGDAAAAWSRITALFTSAPTPLPGQRGGALSLAARAAADLVADLPRGERQHEALLLGEQLTALAAGVGVGEDPLGPGAVPVDRYAAALWSAERARLAGVATIALWTAAASGAARIGRAHDASYCRWRAAGLALAEGRRAMADKLLRRAAQDAREHLPLREAILVP